MKESRHYFQDISMLVLLFATIIWACIYCDYSKSSSKEVVCMDSTFTVKDFTLELFKQDIRFPEVVLRQACLESKFFKSDVFKRTNNPFGFYYKTDYIVFNDYKSAIEYYKSWQDKHIVNKDLSKNEYYDILETLGYAEDSIYIRKLKGINFNNLR